MRRVGELLSFFERPQLTMIPVHVHLEPESPEASEPVNEEPVEGALAVPHSPDDNVTDGAFAEETIPTNKKRKRKKLKFTLGSSNFVSQLFFFWIFRLVQISSVGLDIRNVMLVLCPSETAKVTGDKLDYIWKEEMTKYGE